MRHSNPASIVKGEETVLEASPVPGAGDFLTRVNSTITNFKELLKMVEQVRGGLGEEEEPEPSEPQTKPKPSPNPEPRTPGLLDYIQLAIKAGYGDVPIGKLIEQASPHTLKKVMEIFKNVARPNQ